MNFASSQSSLDTAIQGERIATESEWIIPAGSVRSGYSPMSLFPTGSSFFSCDDVFSFQLGLVGRGPSGRQQPNSPQVREMVGPPYVSSCLSAEWASRPYYTKSEVSSFN